jgi:hypothetical protein
MRLNERNYYDNVRKSRTKKDAISPFRFMQMLEGRDDHERERYNEKNINKLRRTYFRLYMERL